MPDIDSTAVGTKPDNEGSFILSQIDSLILGGEHNQALAALEQLCDGKLLGDDGDVRVPRRQQLQYLALKLFNRMQWLIEAAPVADALASQARLNRDELLELALYRVVLGQPGEARRYFSQILKRFGNDPLILSEIAFTYDQQAMQQKAEELLAKLTASYRKKQLIDDTALRIFLRLAYLRELDTADRKFIEVQLESASAHHFSRLAHILAIDVRREKNFEREMDLLIAANRQAKALETDAGIIWSAHSAEKRLEVIKEVFPKPTPDWLKNVSCDDSEIVVVLGMPRSGTTLLEQIIGAHSRVGNCGESMAMSNALARGIRQLGGLLELGENSDLRNLRHLTPEIFGGLLRRYLQYQRLLSSAEVITDKQLALIDVVGLIANLFPRAKFVYIERDPLDNCVSLMQRDFANAPYSNDPLHILQEGESYARRMGYWKKLYPGRIYSLSYEELVANSEREFPRLIDACGLEWEAQITDFHRRQNSVRTPSASQVRAGLNTLAVEKWRQYERMIKPAIEYLQGQ